MDSSSINKDCFLNYQNYQNYPKYSLGGETMAFKLRKPILIGGIGLSAGLWLWDSVLNSSLIEMGELTVVGAVALGGGFWWLKQKVNFAPVSSGAVSPLNKEAVKEAIALAQKAISFLETEAPDRDVSQLKQQLAQLAPSLERQSLQLAVTGAKQVGKTSLKELLTQENIRDVSWIETAPLLTTTDSLESALDSDLVLFVTAGDLTDSEWQVLQKLATARVRVLLIFNQQDRYLPVERGMIWQKLRHKVEAIIEEEDVLAVAAAPVPLKVKQHQADGSIEEWMEEQKPEVGSAIHRLTAIVERERKQLVLASTWRQAVGVKEQAKEILNEVRRERAVPVVEKYQWIAAAAAFANPVAALDLLATVAINGQMLVDMSAIYQDKFSLAQAQEAAGTIGQLMLKLGLVELSTQTIGSMLKTNAVTYVAGGAIQGVSAAYLTRIAGLSLIEYFQERDLSVASEEEFNLARLGEKFKQVFARNQRTAFLQGFVQQALTRLSPKTAQAV